MGFLAPATIWRPKTKVSPRALAEPRGDQCVAFGLQNCGGFFFLKKRAKNQIKKQWRGYAQSSLPHHGWQDPWRPAPSMSSRFHATSLIDLNCSITCHGFSGCLSLTPKRFCHLEVCSKKIPLCWLFVSCDPGFEQFLKILWIPGWCLVPRWSCWWFLPVDFSIRQTSSLLKRKKSFQVHNSNRLDQNCKAEDMHGTEGLAHQDSWCYMHWRPDKINLNPHTMHGRSVQQSVLNGTEVCGKIEISASHRVLGSSLHQNPESTFTQKENRIAAALLAARQVACVMPVWHLFQSLCFALKKKDTISGMKFSAYLVCRSDPRERPLTTSCFGDTKFHFSMFRNFLLRTT